MAASALSRFASKYAVVIFFPTVTVSTIYADWSHTQAWKKQQKQLANKQELLKE